MPEPEITPVPEVPPAETPDLQAQLSAARAEIDAARAAHQEAASAAAMASQALVSAHKAALYTGVRDPRVLASFPDPELGPDLAPTTAAVEAANRLRTEMSFAFLAQTPQAPAPQTPVQAPNSPVIGAPASVMTDAQWLSMSINDQAQFRARKAEYVAWCKAEDRRKGINNR
jgi:hypothetical protein